MLFTLYIGRLQSDTIKIESFSSLLHVNQFYEMMILEASLNERVRENTFLHSNYICQAFTRDLIRTTRQRFAMGEQIMHES